MELPKCVCGTELPLLDLDSIDISTFEGHWCSELDKAVRLEEENLSIKDFCISCGHYHNPIKHKDPRKCVLGKGCKCSPKGFISRKFGRSFL